VGSRTTDGCTSARAASMTCSQLSMRSSAERDRKTVTIDWVKVCPGTLRHPQRVRDRARRVLRAR
jgi:hypothetical protein